MHATDRSGRWGVLRSEVKEEAAGARSTTGDMNGAVRPGGPIAHVTTRRYARASTRPDHARNR
ncbi:MAG: hypothetical protein M9915_13870, partial [Rhizobacter sp.]|nr:hypothetical protein [Rhizobacter sp.]